MIKSYKLFPTFVLILLLSAPSISYAVLEAPEDRGVTVYSLGYVALGNGFETAQRNAVMYESSLFMIDPITLEARKLGATGFNNCTALDHKPNGHLLANCHRPEAPYVPVLVKLDKSTGEGVEIGPTGIAGNIADMTIYSLDQKFAYEEPEVDPHNLHEVDPGTGAATVLGAPALEGIGNALIAWGDGDELKLISWVDGSNKVYELDMENANATFVKELTMLNSFGEPIDEGPCLLRAADSLNGRGVALDVDLVAAGRAYLVASGYDAVGLVELDGGAVMGAQNQRFLTTDNVGLGLIDFDASTITVAGLIDTKGYVLDGIAVEFREPRPIPTMSGWVMIGFSALLFFTAMLFIIRRKNALNTNS